MVDKHCKYFHHEPFLTPNNFDIYIDEGKIPSNIPKENVPNLTNRLQKLVPPTKILHINLDTNPETWNESNAFSIKTKLKINNTEVMFL